MKNLLRDNLIEISHEVFMAQKDIREGNEKNVSTRLNKISAILTVYVSYTEYAKMYKQKRIQEIEGKIKKYEDQSVAMGIPSYRHEERANLKEEIKRVNASI